MKNRTALVTIVALLGCTVRHGEWLSSYPPARGPAGLAAEVRLSGEEGTLSGELLAIDERGLLLLHQGTVVRIPYASIHEAEFPHRSSLRLESGAAPAPAAADTLRLLSRFPQGVEEDLLERLLEAYGQETVVEIGSETSATRPGGHPAAGRTHGGDGHAASAPASRDSVEAFVAAVREATVRFRDRSVAIREGYRKLGPDFPAMGEHWIQPGLVIEGDVDPARPPVLSYATFEGRVVLTGVAYTLPLGPGEDPPPFLGQAGVWHDHSSRVDEESLLLNHSRRHGRAAAGGSRGSRLAMVHVWAWAENPAGILAQHNWALPFRRVGLPVRADAAPEAVRALSLAGGGAEYYAALLEAASDTSPRERERFRSALEEHRSRVEAWVRERREPRPYDERPNPDLAPLVEVWRSLWRELETGSEPGTWERLAGVRMALEGRAGP